MKYTDVKLVFGMIRCTVLIVQLALCITAINGVTLDYLFAPFIAYTLLLVMQPILIKIIDYQEKRGWSNEDL